MNTYGWILWFAMRFGGAPETPASAEAVLRAQLEGSAEPALASCAATCTWSAAGFLPATATGPFSTTSGCPDLLASAPATPGSYPVALNICCNQVPTICSRATGTLVVLSASPQIGSVSATPNPAQVGTPVQLEVQATGKPPLSFAWTTPAGSLIGQRPILQTSGILPGTHLVTASVSNAFGSRSASINLSVTSPQLAFWAAECPFGVCMFYKRDPVFFALAAGINITKYEYDWSADGVFEEVRTSPATQHLFATSGNFRPKVRLTYGTGQTLTLQQASVITILSSPGAARFYTVSPCRLVDTRNPAGPQGGPVLSDGLQRDMSLRGLCGIPQSAVALAVNVTVTGGTARGFLRFAPGTRPEATSTVAFGVGATRASSAMLALGPTGAASVVADLEGPGTVHLVLDVSGYWR